MNYYQKGKTYYDKSMPPKNIKIPGYIEKVNGIPLKETMPTSGTFNLFPVDEGFEKGTIFRGVYKPYKNYKPIPLTPTNEKEKMLYDVDKYFFALHEIRMYLDDYPDDQEAINVFNEYQEAYIKAKHAYESKYGALDIEAPNLDESPWEWTMGKWPWEGGK